MPASFGKPITAMGIDVQPKLLRSLEEREFTRLGSHKPIKAEVEILAETPGAHLAPQVSL